MTGKFKTPEGKEVSVIEWDEPNKILRAKFPGDRVIWIGKTEYSTWKKLGTETKVEKPQVFVHVPDIPAQMTEEQEASVVVNEVPVEVVVPLVAQIEKLKKTRKTKTKNI